MSEVARFYNAREEFQSSETRIADFYIGVDDGSVFIDFNKNEQNLIYIKGISFDGYGYCHLDDKVIPMNEANSQRFQEILNENNLQDKDIQKEIQTMIIKNISENKSRIWEDALEEYDLLESI